MDYDNGLYHCLGNFMQAQFPYTRLRRLRHSAIMRDLVRDITLSMDDLIYPMFIKVGSNINAEIKSMPGQFQLSVDQLPNKVKQIQAAGVKSVLLFGIVEEKDALGVSGYLDNNIIVQAVQCIKDLAPELIVMTDVCLCDYTDHGHCGVVENNQILNDPTLELIAKMAVQHAKAGSDVVAPSGMMDGAVGSIRQALDSEGFGNTLILSYAVKYASAMYGPFRDALESAPRFGDRKSHQMDPGNIGEALREVELDVAEGADMVMVKPALPYLDITQRVKQQFPGVPLATYQVSGEYSMIKAAAKAGWLDERAAVLESLLSMKRAGANMILSYFALDLAAWL